MTLLYPTGFAWVGALIGVEWPEADEDSLRRIATAWRDAGEDVKALSPELESAAQEVQRNMQGATTQALDQLFRDLLSGDLSPDKIAEAANKAAEMSDTSATNVEFTKLSFYATLAVTALQIILAWAEAVETLGASLAQIPIIEAIGRFAVQIGLKELLDKIAANVAGKILLQAVKGAATNAALAAVQNAGLQGYQIAAGGRKDFDLGSFVKDVSVGAVGGAASGAAGEAASKGLSKLAGQDIDEITHFGTRAGLKAVAGATDGATGATASGLYANKVYGDKFDARTVLGGAATGALGAGGRTAKTPESPSGGAGSGGAGTGGGSGSGHGGSPDGQRDGSTSGASPGSPGSPGAPTGAPGSPGSGATPSGSSPGGGPSGGAPAGASSGGAPGSTSGSSPGGAPGATPSGGSSPGATPSGTTPGAGPAGGSPSSGSPGAAPSNAPTGGGPQVGQHDSTATPAPPSSGGEPSNGSPEGGAGNGSVGGESPHVGDGSGGPPGNQPSPPGGEGDSPGGDGGSAPGDSSDGGGSQPSPPSQPNPAPDTPTSPQTPNAPAPTPDPPSPPAPVDPSQPGLDGSPSGSDAPTGQPPHGGHDEPGGSHPEALPSEPSTPDGSGAPAPTNGHEAPTNVGGSPYGVEPTAAQHDPTSTTPQSAGQPAPSPQAPASTTPMSAGQPVHASGPGVPTATSPTVHAAPVPDGPSSAPPQTNAAPTPTTSAPPSGSSAPVPAANPSGPLGNTPAPVGNSPTPASNGPAAAHNAPPAHTTRVDTPSGDNTRSHTRAPEGDSRQATRTDGPRPDPVARQENSSTRGDAATKPESGATHSVPKSDSHGSDRSGTGDPSGSHPAAAPTPERTGGHASVDKGAGEPSKHDGATPEPDTVESSTADSSPKSPDTQDQRMNNGSSTPDRLRGSQADNAADFNNPVGQQNPAGSAAETTDSGPTGPEGTSSTTSDDAGGSPDDDPIPTATYGSQHTTGDGTSDTGDVAADADAAALLVLGADATHPALAGGRETTQTRARLDAARTSAQADRQQHSGADDQHLDTDGDGHSEDQRAGSETSRAGEDEVNADVPDLPSDQPSFDHSGNDPANHSATDALSAIDEHFGRPADEHAVQRPSDDLGLSGRDLEKLGSGELKPTDPNTLHQQLTELGDGAAALVVVEHPLLLGDDGAPGAHAFAAINRDGEIVRVDGPPGARVETPLADGFGGRSRAMTFDADGSPVDPLGLQPTAVSDGGEHNSTEDASDGSASVPGGPESVEHDDEASDAEGGTIDNETDPPYQSRADVEEFLDQDAELEKDKKSTIKSKDGGSEAAERDFAAVTNGHPVTVHQNGTRVARLPGGVDVTLRSSSDGRVTISIQERGTSATKYRYTP